MSNHPSRMPVGREGVSDSASCLSPRCPVLFPLNRRDSTADAARGRCPRRDQLLRHGGKLKEQLVISQTISIIVSHPANWRQTGVEIMEIPDVRRLQIKMW